METITENNAYSQFVYLSFIVNLCVHFESVCLKIKKWIQTNTIVFFGLN